MAKTNAWIVGPAALGLLLVAGCENIPYYHESLGWFSWSKYDPEIRDIEAEIPAQPVADARAVRDARGGYVYATPPAGATVSLGATPLASTTSAGTTSSAAVTDPASSGGTGAGSPLVGIRNSVSPSVTWRSARGAP